MLAIHRVVEAAHVVIGNLSCQFIQRLSHLRMACQHLRPNDRHGFVRREVVAIVFQNEQIQRGDQSIGGISRCEVHLLVLESARQQAQVHDARGLGEAQAVGCGQALVTIGTLHELVTEAGAPLRRVGGCLGDGLQAEPAGVFAADLDGEGVIESESLSDLEIETPGVFGLDLVVNLLRDCWKAVLSGSQSRRSRCIRDRRRCGRQELPGGRCKSRPDKSGVQPGDEFCFRFAGR